MATSGKKRRILILLFFLLNTGMQCEHDERTNTPQSPNPVRVAGNEYVGSLEGIAIEPGGKTVLVTNHNTNLLSRFNLETGDEKEVLYDPHTPFRMSGVVVEAGGKTALVTRLTSEDEGDLIRVDLATGTYKIIASGFHFTLYAIGIDIEKEGETALVAELCQLTRVNLSDGTKIPVTTVECPMDVAIEPSGETALVLQISEAKRNLWRVNLQTGTIDLISSLTHFTCYNIRGWAVELSMSKAFVSCSRVSSFGGSSGGLLQVDLTTGEAMFVSRLVPRDLVIEEGGKTALGTAGGGIFRIQLT